LDKNADSQETDSSKLELTIFNMAMVDAIKTAYKDPFEPIFEKGLQKGAILGIEGSIARSVIVTLAQDKTCKFWEYGNEIKGIYSYNFLESPFCSSLHPLSN
jgi:hypothetical protein